ncbi:ornithine cyclodeaminase family protein, partial [Anaerotruncus sp. 80]|nr:ornithine cyclodeaminase family protein [Anaerotruncus colihominis]NCF03693.1 ornithine cyclodeaminase family protein [Anaerotruncus sp. 80]
EITEDVYVDLPYACEESGDLSTRIEMGLLDEKNVKFLHNVLDGSQPKPASDTVVFKTVGMALVDLAAAEYICETAEKENIGVEVEF